MAQAKNVGVLWWRVRSVEVPSADIVTTVVRGKRSTSWTNRVDVWVKLVNPDQPVPTDPKALSFLTLTTRPTLRTDFRAADGGKTAVYMLRWVNTRGEKGLWSEVCTATMAA